MKKQLLWGMLQFFMKKAGTRNRYSGPSLSDTGDRMNRERLKRLFRPAHLLFFVVFAIVVFFVILEVAYAILVTAIPFLNAVSAVVMDLPVTLNVDIFLQYVKEGLTTLLAAIGNALNIDIAKAILWIGSVGTLFFAFMVYGIGAVKSAFSAESSRHSSITGIGWILLIISVILQVGLFI